MVTTSGQEGVRRYMEALPQEIERKLLPGAARAAGKVIADEARDQVASQEVAEAIIIRRRSADGKIMVLITVKPGWAYSVGNWLEWGTSQHFISVDDSQRAGMSVRRINESHQAGSLVIGGQFVGSTVLHPGARPHPFLRPALDRKHDEAIAAAQRYINTHVSGGVIIAESGGGEP